jgi:hypothetical protein
MTYTVIRTDMTTMDRQVLSYPPTTDYLVAVRRAAAYQRNFDPNGERFFWRVHMIS